MIPLLHLVGDVAVWVAFVTSAVFVVTYALLAPWRRSGEGWHLMTFTAVLATAFGWIAYRAITAPRLPVGTPTEVARTVILTALAALLVWRLALLISTQVRRRR